MQTTEDLDFTPPNLIYPHQILERFFASSTCTQNECNAKLHDYCRSQNLTNVTLDCDQNRQGMSSYTVFVDATNDTNQPTKLVAQFRKPGEELEAEKMAFARSSYGERFVLETFIMNNSSFPWQLSITAYGGEYMPHRKQNYEAHHLRTAVEDLAEFLTASYSHPQPRKGETDKLISQLGVWSTWKISPVVDSIVKTLLENSGITSAGSRN